VLEDLFSGTLSSSPPRVRIELESPLFSWAEIAQTRKGGGLSFAKLQDDLVNHAVQLVGGLRL